MNPADKPMNPGDHPQGPDLQAYLDNELPADKARIVASHCEGCKDCSKILRELESVREALAGDPPASLFSPVWPNVAEHAGQVSVRRQHMDRRRFRPVLALTVSTAGAVGILLGFLVGSSPNRDVSAGHKEADWASIGVSWDRSGSASLLDVYFSGRATSGIEEDPERNE
jgi:anti-sigma factor RsiW